MYLMSLRNAIKHYCNTFLKFIDDIFSNNKQQTTNNKQQTTNNKQQTTNKFICLLLIMIQHCSLFPLLQFLYLL